MNVEEEICAKTQEEGFGATYERIMLERLLKNLQKKYKFKTILELGCHITKGFDNLALKENGCKISVASVDINALKEKWEKFKEKPKFVGMASQGKYDLVWNFAMVQLKADIINQMKRNSQKYVLFFTPNILNYGTPFHVAYHLLTGTECHHAERGKVILRRKKCLERVARVYELKVLESGYVDMPWWPDTAFGIREVKENFFKMKLKPVETEFKDPKTLLKKIKRMRFIEDSKFLGPIKHLFAHHQYVFCELK